MEYYKDHHITVYNKDCRDMGELPDNSIQCVVTSPPYWGLRKYAGLPDLVDIKDFDIIYNEDCLKVLKRLGDNSIDAIVTDPPYNLGFMGKKWDSTGVAFSLELWEECLRVIKPGGHLLSFGGTRTYHRMVCAIEDAGFEIRDCIIYCYGSGFPKSLNIAKQIAKKQGAGSKGNTFPLNQEYRDYELTPEAKLWEGYGTALKPAYEPIVLAMKPLDGTFANNALKHKVAGLNIDECRIGLVGGETHKGGFQRKYVGEKVDYQNHGVETDLTPKGRFPANFIHDGSQEVMELFPDVRGGGKPKTTKQGFRTQYVDGEERDSGINSTFYGGDSGSAARFFMNCPQDTCFLFNLLSQLRYDIMNIGGISCQITKKLNTLAQTVERYFGNTLATTTNTALGNALEKQGKKSDHYVKAAANPCDICVIHIALVLAEVRSLDFRHEELQAMQAYTGNSKSYILLQNLVSYAGKWASIDTTQIITDLLISCGCVNPAIISSIQETRKSEPHRFLYTPKASKKEREAGLEGMPDSRGFDYLSNTLREGGGRRVDRVSKNNHPTVKPLALMEYLVKLVTRSGHIVLDPFIGSGTTAMACVKLGRHYIGCELDKGYYDIAIKRINIATLHNVGG